MRRAALILSGLLGACATAPKPAAVQPTTLAELEGEYRVVRLGSYRSPGRIDEGVRAAQSLILSDGYVMARVGCNGLNGSVTFTAEDGTATIQSEDLVMTTAGCSDDSRHRRDDALAGLLTEPVSVTQFENGWLRLTGNGPDLLLESEETARLRHAPTRLSEIEGRWFILQWKRGNQPGSPDEPLPPVFIRPDGVAFAGCPFKPGPLSLSPVGTLVSDVGMTGGGGCVLTDPDAETVETVEVSDIPLRLLREEATLEWTADRDLVLRLGEDALRLSRRREER